MVSAEYLEKVKKRLYIVSAYYDDEIRSLIEAARTDMIQSGTREEMAEYEEDDFVLSAIVAFVKAQRGLDATESGRYMKQYASYLFKLTLSGKYRSETNVE